MAEPSRETQGPSGPSEREIQGPSGPSEREIQGPSGPSERETEGPPSAFQRLSEGLEFDRAVFFSDAVFAIAVTLIVVTIQLPSTTNESLAEALSEVSPQILAFFISFAVISSFWVRHHRFVGALSCMTRPLLVLNLAYLAAIAFMPFPADVLGDHPDSALAVSLYAATLATVSFLETAMLLCAHVTGAFRRPLSPPDFRAAMVASSIPVVVFALSAPLAALNTSVAMYSWLAIVPAEMVANRITGGTRRLGL